MVLGLTIGGWLLVNPFAAFGLSRFGVTTYSWIPVPLADFQVRADGAIRWVEKSHDLQADSLTWLLTAERPEVLIVAVGWRSGDRVAPVNARPTKLLILPTGKAMSVCNELKARGTRVAIHVHSTC